MGMTKRMGMVIGIREENVDAYRELHAVSNPGVRDLLEKANMRNFSIFLYRLPDGKLYLFGYYEYVGDDYEADMNHLATEPRNTEWLALCDPMQIPLPGHKGWSVMSEVYHNP